MSQVLPKEGGHALGRCQLENVEQIALDIKVVVQECAEALAGKEALPTCRGAGTLHNAP